MTMCSHLGLPTELTNLLAGKLLYHELTEAESQKLLDAAKEEAASADA